MTETKTHPKEPGGDAVCASIAVFAWNEEEAIGTTLESLLAQSFFKRLRERGSRCEVVCVLNGCTDGTAARAAEIFRQQAREHPAAASFAGRVADLPEKGKMNAWNRYVHEVSAPEAKVLFMMDADILIHEPDTLWNMFQLLEQNPEANVAVDLPRKDIHLRGRKSVRTALSAGMATMTRSAEAQLCGQLYAIRSETARRIYIPKDLGACEDGYLKAMVCTDLLTHEVWPSRLQLAPAAEHTFEAYTSLPAILRNQKRQIIGQTVVHVLLDKHLNRLPREQRTRLAEILRERDERDPGWVKRLISEHLQEKRAFWRLYPDLLPQHFRRLARLSGPRKAACLPAALAGVCLSFVCSFLAFRSLKTGSIHYWPKAQRLGFKPAAAPVPTRVGAGANQ